MKYSDMSVQLSKVMHPTHTNEVEVKNIH